ncbi:YkgJ family cysteine cluster protein [Clostridium beijerinckii]|jgi:Uncharacterised protein family (UPF0153).|uniref:YkgJ family cysteine cluster protein n=1 Tax=Clostridium beijerinckii TaxID=1520 RepID=A0A7X9XRW9_CLOBE|nr:YkgJ family cysteine cluster protein [Clostridium beijerinckii]NMF07954.1 YkgJ family cysteine cluster protein [Clostridium beijerinckii]
MFKCYKCGLCCCNIRNNILYKELDDGEGICIHYNKESKLCSIYNERPVICRVDEYYELYFRNLMTIEEYYKLNYEACEKLVKSKIV